MTQNLSRTAYLYIMFRLLTVSELAASDCRYHKDCFSKFYSNPVPQQSSSQDDLSFKVLLKVIKSDVNRISTSSSFAEQYSQLCNEKNNHGWTKKWLIERISRYFEDRLICLSSPGLENMYVFKNHASAILKLKQSEDDEYMSKTVNFVGKMISAELSKASKNIPDKVYNIGSLDNITQSQTSETLSNLLGIVHKSLSYGPKTELINSVMPSSFTGRSTSLQCLLGGYFRNISVKRFMKLNKYGVVCSYDELKRLRTSDAKYSNDNAYHLNLPPSNSLVQIVIDNFDLDIASPNGKAQTHSLGMIVTKNESGLSEENKVTIRKFIWRG